MLRVLRALPKPLARRNFVSSVLLSKSWENETVAEIKTELQKRGLSRTGNKSTLISRLTEHEKQKQLESLVSPTFIQQRSASTVTVVGETPGVPPAAEPTTSLPAGFSATTLPDLSQPYPEPPVQVPFVPDFWESSKNKPKPATPESTGPKVSTVASAATHHGGGPSHALHDVVEPVPTKKPAAPVNGGFWFDVVNDMCLPTSVETPTLEWQFSEKDSATKVTPKGYSRKLDPDETRGVWIFLGLLAGSWIASGVAKPEVFPEHAEE